MIKNLIIIGLIIVIAWLWYKYVYTRNGVVVGLRPNTPVIPLVIQDTVVEQPGMVNRQQTIMPTQQSVQLQQSMQGARFQSVVGGVVVR